MADMNASLTNGKGVFAHSKNPLSVPKKGSQLPMENRAGNADRTKVINQAKAQARDEDLRGKMG